VPRTANARGVDLSLREWATEVCTAVGQGVDATHLPDQHNRHASNIDPSRLRLDQVSFGEDRDEVLPRETRGVVDTDALSVDQMPAEIRGGQHYGKSETRRRPAGCTFATKPKAERKRVEPRRRDVEQSVEKADPAIFGGGVLPVGRARHGSADGAHQSDADRHVGGSIVAGSGVAAQQIEDAGDRPGAERDVSEDGMQRVTQPGPVEEVTNAPARRPSAWYAATTARWSPSAIGSSQS
jgi:hypothetical protein